MEYGLWTMDFMDKDLIDNGHHRHQGHYRPMDNGLYGIQPEVCVTQGRRPGSCIAQAVRPGLRVC